MKFLSFVRYTKSQRIAVSVLIFLLIAVELGIWYVDRSQIPEVNTSMPEEIVLLQEQIDEAKSNSFQSPKRNKIQLQSFNPNELTERDWMNLGFSSKQAAVILKYKKSLGGQFSSKQEIANCFVISDEKFEELSPYMSIPKTTVENSSFGQTQDKNQFKSKFKVQYKKFNPNQYNLQDWMAIGFSEKQAMTILKYKMGLGGNFNSLEQIEKCYVISSEKFLELKPYIVIENIKPIVQDVQNQESSVYSIKMETFDPNELTREQWMALGFTEKQVNTIMNYKKSLGGKFIDAATLKKCYSISEEKFAELEPYLEFR